MQYRVNQLILSTLMATAITLLSACAKNNAEHDLTVNKESYQHAFTSVGYASIEAQNGTSFDLKMLNALKASKLEAYKELAEQIYGVLLSSENAVNDSRLQSDSIEVRVNGLVRGAKVLKSYHEGGIYITELALDMRSISFLNAPEFNEEQAPAVEVEQQVYY